MKKLADGHRSLVDLVHEELLRRIADREFEEGSRLVIDQLAAEFGTSLIPVREALARLSAERLVIYTQNKGYRVAPAPDAVELKEMFSARLILEVGSLEVAIQNIDKATIRHLEDINTRMPRAASGTSYGGFKEFIGLNREFHLAIVDAARNPFISEAYRRLGYHQRIIQTLSGYGIQDLEKIVREHWSIIEQLKTGSLQGAQDALRRHISDAGERLESDITATMERS